MRTLPGVRSAVAVVMGPDEMDWRDKIEAVARGQLVRDEPMAGHTTLGIGGPADLWFEPEHVEDLSAVLAVVRKDRIPYTIIGGGSNLLIADKGLRGLTVHLTGGLEDVVATEIDDDIMHVTFPAGLTTAAVRRYAREAGLMGPEFLIGIPGTLGGAIQMNAGTRLGEMVDVVVGAEVALPTGATWLDADAFGFAYRTATVPPGGIVTRIKLAFRRVDPEAARGAQAAARAELSRRHRTQPKGKSAGSIFKNPPGDHAGRLIEAAGLKGTRVGGAVVSELHANFIMNEGEATAADVIALIEICRREVRSQFGVSLELEVKLLGEF